MKMLGRILFALSIIVPVGLLAWLVLPVVKWLVETFFQFFGVELAVAVLLSILGGLVLGLILTSNKDT